MKLAFATLLFACAAHAQSPVRLAIAGDSTVADYPLTTGQRGWGQFIPEYFNASVKVFNLAKNGRSTKTFLNEGLWAKTLALKPDLVLIQFGHNDSHDPKMPEATNAAGDYSDYLRKFVDEARAVGAVPILVTPVQRRTKVDSLIPYADAMRKVAAEKKTALIDLHRSSGELYRELGPAGAAELAANATDSTHFNEKGARAMAALVMKELPALDARLKANLIESRATLHAWPGTAPQLDGVLSPGEWDDATRFTGVLNWTHTFTPTTDARDLAVTGYVKHDGSRLYFAFDVADDILYGIDTPRWLPSENPNAHELSPRGYPWFGDEIELLINAANRWTGHEGAAGNGSSWQMVCNLTKSRLHGVGTGGLLEGEPRNKPEAWETYRRWIETGAQQAAAKPKPGGKGYIIEWAVNFDPCLEIEPGKFYSPSLGDRQVGMNIAIGDLDTPAQGTGNFGNFHHEDWFAGDPKLRTELREWGTLWIHAKR